MLARIKASSQHKTAIKFIKFLPSRVFDQSIKKDA